MANELVTLDYLSGEEAETFIRESVAPATPSIHENNGLP